MCRSLSSLEIVQNDQVQIWLIHDVMDIYMFIWFCDIVDGWLRVWNVIIIFDHSGYYMFDQMNILNYVEYIKQLDLVS